MNPYVYYVLWGVLLVGAALWSVLLLARNRNAQTTVSKVALIVPLVSSIASLSTFISFTLVFIVGKSSNVAQLAQGGGMDWWGFWFDIFMPSMFGNMALLLVSGICVFLPPYPPKHWPSTLCRLTACIGVFLSLYHLAQYAPDA